MVSDVTLTGVANNAQKTGSQGIKLAQDFTQFLTLLTTQLQNQDPLNPMDSNEFTNQLVQFSQVEQAINTNQKLDDLVSLNLGSVSSVALGYVGLDIMYQSGDMSFDGATPVKIAYALEKDASTANVNVYDEDGKLVYSHQIPRTAGKNEISWDGSLTGGGTAPEGTYKVTIAALDGDGKAISTSTAVSGHVKGIESQNGIVYLLVGERAVPLGQVINATVPQSAQTPGEEGA